MVLPESTRRAVRGTLDRRFTRAPNTVVGQPDE
jgi:hypothetical protein